jgi:hypothetical protein
MVNSRVDYAEMLRRAGFRASRSVDVTREYLRVSERSVRARNRHVAALTAALGEARVREMEHDGRLNLQGIRKGFLRRSLIVAG